MGLRPENQAELHELDKLLSLGLNIGAAAVGMDDAFDSTDKRRELNSRLAEDYPSLNNELTSILGRMTKLLSDDPARQNSDA